MYQFEEVVLFWGSTYHSGEAHTIPGKHVPLQGSTYTLRKHKSLWEGMLTRFTAVWPSYSLQNGCSILWQLTDSFWKLYHLLIKIWQLHWLLGFFPIPVIIEMFIHYKMDVLHFGELQPKISQSTSANIKNNSFDFGYISILHLWSICVKKSFVTVAFSCCFCCLPFQSQRSHF